jgi:hypothetical protein
VYCADLQISATYFAAKKNQRRCPAIALHWVFRSRFLNNEIVFLFSQIQKNSRFNRALDTLAQPGSTAGYLKNVTETHNA